MGRGERRADVGLDGGAISGHQGEVSRLKAEPAELPGGLSIQDEGKNCVSQPRTLCPPGDIGQRLETFLIVTLQEEVLPVSSEKRPPADAAKPLTVQVFSNCS